MCPGVDSLWQPDLCFDKKRKLYFVYRNLERRSSFFSWILRRSFGRVDSSRTGWLLVQETCSACCRPSARLAWEPCRWLTCAFLGRCWWETGLPRRWQLGSCSGWRCASRQGRSCLSSGSCRFGRAAGPCCCHGKPSSCASSRRTLSHCVPQPWTLASCPGQSQSPCAACTSARENPSPS